MTTCTILSLSPSTKINWWIWRRKLSRFAGKYIRYCILQASILVTIVMVYLVCHRSDEDKELQKKNSKSSLALGLVGRSVVRHHAQFFAMTNVPQLQLIFNMFFHSQPELHCQHRWACHGFVRWHLHHHDITFIFIIPVTFIVTFIYLGVILIITDYSSEYILQKPGELRDNIYVINKWYSLKI